MNTSASIEISNAEASTRAAGVSIAAATILSTIFVALDQNAVGANPHDIMQSMVGMQGMKALVHGVAIASVTAYAFGFASLAARLGLRKPLVLAGLISYLIGCFAMIVATTFDGFVSTSVAQQFVNASPESVKTGFNIIIALGSVVGGFAKVGWVLQAVGVLGWAFVLLKESGLNRVTGAVGFCSSALVIGIVAVTTEFSMTSILAILCAQLIWNLAAAVRLIRKA